jgi:hypothetical protein
MNNLIPQLRPDRNGKVVTRHVKADASPQKNRTFAAPVLPPQGAGLSQKEIEKERPLKKVKKRKIAATGVEIAALHSQGRIAETGSIGMSDEEIYRYLSSGLTMTEGVALYAMGVGAHEWQGTPEQGEHEPDGVYSTRVARFRNEVKRLASRRERFSDVSHRLELRGVPADVASKSIENGLSMKALSGYLTEAEVCEIYSKNGYLKNNVKVMDALVDGVIPFDHYKEFGIRNLNNWEKNCPVYREMSTELLSRVVEKTKKPYPSADRAAPSETILIKLAAKDERVLDLRLPELMWHGYRVERDGGVFSYEEAKIVDDFIHEVRSRGIIDLDERPTMASNDFKNFYPDSGQWDSRYDPAKVLDWHNAGLSTDNIISGLQNRWNKEQAVSVYLEDTAASLADGIL